MNNFILSFLLSLITFGAFGQHLSTSDSIFVKQQVDSLIMISSDSLGTNNFDAAFAITEDAQKIAIARFGEISEANANCVNQIALINQYSGKYVEAEKIFVQALELKEKSVGKSNVNYCGTLINIGSLYSTMDKFEGAESHFLQAKQIFEEQLNDRSNQFYINLLTNLGLLYCYSGRFTQAEPIMLNALQINGEKNGRNSIGFCGDLVNLGMVYGQMGKYEDAEALFLEAKGIFEDSLDNRTHQFYSICINNLAYMYRILGLYDQSEQLFFEILPRMEKEFGKTHPRYASALMDYAGLSYEKGDLVKAQSTLEEVLDIYKKNEDQESQAYSNVVGNLANIYRKNGKYEAAEVMLLEKLTIDKATFGEDNSMTAVSISNLAHLYTENLGKLEEAEKMYLKSSKIIEKHLGIKHEDYLHSLSYLAKLYTNQGKYAAATELYQTSSKGQQKNLLRATRHLGDRELYSFAQKLEHPRQLVFSNTMLSTGKEGADVCLDDVLFRKGFLLQESEKVKRLAKTTETGAALYAELSETENALAQQLSQPFDIRDSAQITSLTTQAAKLEKDLARTVAGFGAAQAQTSWQAVQAALKPNEGTIEFVHFDFWREELTDSVMYAAILVTPNMKEPKFIALFEEKALENLLQTTGKRKSDYVNKVYNSEDLYAMLWQPLEAHPKGIDKIYFSPSGLLNRISLGAIPVEEGAVLADKYQLVQKGSTRQVIDNQRFESENNSIATLFGGVQFDMDETAIIQANVDDASRNIDDSRGMLNFAETDSLTRGGAWGYLGWTEKEVDVLRSILKNAGMESNLYKGFSATEEAFKSVSGATSPRVLHLATHGYFFPDPKSDSSNDESVFESSEHPMIRSGLILAGGNHAWKSGSPAKPSMEDGVLTAYEISQMDLSNTELVVLSACETGLGDIQGNEGVYGLQRAFKIAGAEYLIMSLWQVPDFQTQELMTTFYEKWLNDKIALPGFRAAQKEMREKYEHPYFWAGFVLVE